MKFRFINLNLRSPDPKTKPKIKTRYLRNEGSNNSLGGKNIHTYNEPTTIAPRNKNPIGNNINRSYSPAITTKDFLSL